MKVVLRSDIENLGKLGDIVTIKPGYGRNYLLPQGLAMSATPSNLKKFELEHKKLQAHMDAIRATADALSKRISGIIMTIPMHVGDNDKLYGSVTTAMIAQNLFEQGIEIDRRRILLESNIRTLGEHRVRIRLHADIITEFIINVISDEKLNDVDLTTTDKAEEISPA